MQFNYRFVFVASVVSALALATVAATARADLLGVHWDSGNLYRVSTTDASLGLVGSTGVSHMGSLTLRPSDGFLYGFTSGSSSVLYRVDPSNANASAVGPLGIGFVFEGGLTIAPDGTAYATNQGDAHNPVLFTVDLDTGSATPIGLISGGSHDINGLAFRSDGKLVGLDDVSNALLEIDPVTANSSVIATVSPTVGSVGGMAVVGDTGYFSTAGPTASVPGSNELYSFDLFTGSHTLVGSFSPAPSDAGISGLARIPEPSTLILLATAALGVLVTRRRRRTA